MKITKQNIGQVREALVQYYKDKLNGESISNSSDVYDYFSSIFIGQVDESFYSLYLNSKNKVLFSKKISEGVPNCTIVYLRKIFEYAMGTACSSIILAHNHPSGNVEPSEQDCKTTRDIVTVGKLLDIRILDHLIIGSSGKYFSFGQKGLIELYKDSITK